MTYMDKGMHKERVNGLLSNRRRSVYLSLFLTIFIIISGCYPNSNVNDPLRLLWNKSGEKTDKLIIFLPGLNQAAETFEKAQFFTIARQMGVKADFLAASVHIDHLFEQKLIERLQKDIFSHLYAQGYKNIWLVGMSLGGLNSLLFYSERPDAVCGVVVLAPFLAGSNLTKEIKKAGGIKKWIPTPEKEDLLPGQEVVEQHKLWQWIKNEKNKKYLDKVYLGYGDKDVYVESIKMFENFLPAKNVVTLPGYHKLKTGIRIWTQQLKTRKETGLLSSCH